MMWDKMTLTTLNVICAHEKQAYYLPVEEGLKVQYQRGGRELASTVGNADVYIPL
jgi:hypothetical protein